MIPNRLISSQTSGASRLSLPRLFRRALLAALFFFHPAAHSIVGKAYFALTGLNSMFVPLGGNVFLQPAILLSAALLIMTPVANRLLPRRWDGVSIGLGLLFVGAVTGLAWNFRADVVAMTFCSVFLSGLFVFVSLVRYPLEESDIHTIFVALSLGLMFPLMAGLQVFYQNWGIPDLSTVIAAHSSANGIQAYEEVTFGSRGNTASLLVLVGPPLLALLFDRRRVSWPKAIYALCLALIVVNLVILQQRAAIFICLVSIAFLWCFKAKTVSSHILYLATGAVVLFAVTTYSPAVANLIDERFVPALTWDVDSDHSVSGRTEAIQEGVGLAVANLPFGLGPGSAVKVHSQGSAHQFNVQQGLENGVIGFLGSVVLSISALLLLIRAISAGDRLPATRWRFIFAVGPASYLVHGVLANVAINFGWVNTWVVLFVGMLALALSAERDIPAEVSEVRRSLVRTPPPFRRPPQVAVPLQVLLTRQS